MASSLSPDCTPLKHSYDVCFNSWFQGYLQPTLKPGQENARKEYSKAKAKELEDSCGSVWEEYRKCVAKAVKEKGLSGLLNQAQAENPLKEPDTPSSAEFTSSPGT